MYKINRNSLELKKKRYEFDTIYFNDNIDIFSNDIRPILDKILSVKGSHEAIVAYGCTSSGKTHTMNNKIDGIIKSSLEYLFSESVTKGLNFKFKLRCTEVYMEQCKDLLPQHTPINLRANLTQPVLRLLGTPSINSEATWSKLEINTLSEALDALDALYQARKVSSNKANDSSSRSHLLIYLDIYENKSLMSQLILGDLAGSERYKNTGIERNKQESGSINKSLHTFHNVIHAIRERRLHIPVRDSKLTRLLSKCLIGSGNMCLIVTINMDPKFIDETVHVLEFAATVRQVEPLRAKIDTGNYCRKRLNFHGPSTPKALKAMIVPDQEDCDWESAVEEFIRERESQIREQLTMEHADNSDKLRNLYETMLEDAVAETEEKANRKIDVLVHQYESEIAKLRAQMPGSVIDEMDEDEKRRDIIALELKCSELTDENTLLQGKVIENEERLKQAWNTIENLDYEIKAKVEEIETLNSRLDQMRIDMLKQSLPEMNFGSLSPVINGDNKVTPKQKYTADFGDGLIVQGDVCTTPSGGKRVVFDSINNTPSKLKAVTPNSKNSTPQTMFTKTGLLSAFKLKVPKIPAQEDKENQELKERKKVKLRSKKLVLEELE